VVTSTLYRRWQEVAGKEVMRQRPQRHHGPVEVSIELGAPNRRPFDPDNKVKGILDLLVAMRVVESDDREIVRKVSVCEGSGFTGAKVTIAPAEQQPELAA